MIPRRLCTIFSLANTKASDVLWESDLHVGYRYRLASQSRGTCSCMQNIKRPAHRHYAHLKSIFCHQSMWHRPDHEDQCGCYDIHSYVCVFLGLWLDGCVLREKGGELFDCCLKKKKTPYGVSLAVSCVQERNIVHAHYTQAQTSMAVRCLDCAEY